MNRRVTKLALLMLQAAAVVAPAQVTFTTTTTADVFLATGSSNNPAGNDLAGLNFGGAGTLVVAPDSAAKGGFQSVIKFNLADAIGLFDMTCGTNNWTISSVALELASNYGVGGVQPNNPIFNVINGGQFVIEWLSEDNWLEGTGNPNLPTTDGLTLDSMSSLLASPHQILCTNTYSPPGVNVQVTWRLPLTKNLAADIAAGGDVSFYFRPADDQINYLFNSHGYGRGNEPQIHVSAAPLLSILSGYLTNGSFHLAGLGAPNAPHQIQATTNLSTTNWQTLDIITADETGMIQFNDTAATNQWQRFYRLAR